jgi:thioredoxin 1
MPISTQEERMSEPIHVSDADFEAEILKSDIPAMVDFWAAWCGPCRAIAPVVEELAREYAGKVKVGKMNVDENAKTPTKYGIRAIPTLIIFKSGQVVEQITGAVSRSIIENALKKAL